MKTAKSLFTSVLFNPIEEFRTIATDTGKEMDPFKWKSRLVSFIKLFILLLLVNAAIMILMAILESKSLTVFHERSPINVTIWEMFVVVTLEEFMFRLPMKFNHLYLYIAILALVNHFVPCEEFCLFLYGSCNMVLRILLLLAFGTLIFIPVKQFYRPNLMKAWMVLSCICFACVHWRNYQTLNVFEQPGVALLMISPQLFAGIVFLYGRMKYDIVFAILLHFFFNEFFLTIPDILSIPK